MQHWTFTGGQRSRAFTSRNDGHQRRRCVWICRQCRRWHEKGVGGLPAGHTGRPKQCLDCGSKDLLLCDSALEAQRFMQLVFLEDQGVIRGLRHHPRFALSVPSPSGQPVVIAHYEADADYFDESGCWVVEDTKGVADPELEPDRKKRERLNSALDPLFRRNRKHFEASHACPHCGRGIKVLIVSKT